MSNIDPVLCIDELRQILSVSTATIYRWLAESRSQDGGAFPLPVNTGGRKRRLLWTRSSIQAFLDNQNSGTHQQPSLNFVSAAEHRKRDRAARQSLKAMGVKLNDSEK